MRLLAARVAAVVACAAGDPSVSTPRPTVHCASVHLTYRATVGDDLPSVYSARAADLDGDGNLDVVAASYGSSGLVTAHMNDGALLPTFAGRLLSSDCLGAHSVEALDVDGDGVVDAVASAARGDVVTLLSGPLYLSGVF